MTTFDRSLNQIPPHPEAQTGRLVVEGSFLEWGVVESSPVAECGNQVEAPQAVEMASHWEAEASAGLVRRTGSVGMEGMACRDQGALRQGRRAGQEVGKKVGGEGKQLTGNKSGRKPVSRTTSNGERRWGYTSYEKGRISKVDNMGSSLIGRSFDNKCIVG